MAGRGHGRGFAESLVSISRQSMRLMTRFNVLRMTSASLMAASVYLMLATQAHALPLGPAMSFGSGVALIDTGNPLATTEATLAESGAIPIFAAIFDSYPGESDTLLFSFRAEDSGREIVVSTRGTRAIRDGASRLDEGAGNAFAEHAPVTPSTTVLLISSGVAGATRRRRRNVPRLNEITTPTDSWKEVPSKAPTAPPLFDQGSSHAIPLRI